jgi:hypothetical protein
MPVMMELHRYLLVHTLLGWITLSSSAPVTVPAPTNFVIFQENNGHVANVGDILFILAVFPEKSDKSSWSIQDPGTMNDNAHSYDTTYTDVNGNIVYTTAQVAAGSCSPSIVLSMGSSQTLSVNAQSYAWKVEDTYKLNFADQAELYTSDGSYNPPWVFLLRVTMGMTSTVFFVKSITIPIGCNYNTYTFTSTKPYTSQHTVMSNLYSPCRIDSAQPIVTSYRTPAATGRYTAGATIPIIVHFNKEVVFSQLPDPYSQAAIDAAAIGDVPSGCPFVQLNSNAYAPLRGYALTNDSTRLLFVYQVGEGEETPAGVGLDLAQFSTVQLNGGSIKSARTGVDADFASMSSAYGSVGELTTILDCICLRPCPFKFSFLRLRTFYGSFKKNGWLCIRHD